MQPILTCISDAHDGQLLILAAIICAVGVYASSAIGAEAGRSEGRARRNWAIVSIVASGCTAWATHMVALLAFRPGMPSGFDPILTATSLLIAVLGIGLSVMLAIGQRRRWRRFLAGLVLGVGITALHYMGQESYVITGVVSWNFGLVAASVAVSLVMFGLSMLVAAERSRALRRLAPASIIASIAVLHLGGMMAATLTFDPRVELPASAVSPSRLAPVIAAVCLGLLVLAFMGLRMTRAARTRQRKDRERIRELADLALEGLAVCDGGVVAIANRSLEQLTGMGQAELIGRPIVDLIPGLVLAELPELEERDVELATRDGATVPVRILCREVVLGHRRQMVVAIRDQRERLRTEAHIRTLACTDALTGLLNRVRMKEQVEQHATLARDRGRAFAVLLINLDRFKTVNDTLGQSTGDLLLRRVAERLRSVVGDDNVVARVGGDEFAVLQTNLDDEDGVRRLAALIVDVLGQRYVVDGQPVDIGASAGVVIAPRDGEGASELLRNAGLAMYQAKAEGKATFRLFEPALAERMEARRVLEADLRHGLEAGQFELHYQPLQDARSGEVTGAEALVRWRHPERGLVPPADFIPVCEETGLIAPLGEWVLRTACADAARWPNAIRVAVNLSPVQFRDDGLVGKVTAALAIAGLPAHRLEVEVTEGVLLDDEERTLQVLTELRSIGVGVAMDDFGTGYASLSYLRRFPFSKLKVDRSFVRHLPGDAESAAIMRAILTMAGSIGMATTIEGIETAEQYAFVAAERCGQIQGYYVSRPVPNADFVDFLTGARQAA